MPRIEDLPPELVADAVARAVVDAVSQGGDTETIVARALSRVKGELGLPAGVAGGPGNGRTPASPRPAATPPRTWTTSADGFRPAPLGSGKAVGGAAGVGRALLTEGDVLAAAQGGQTEIRLTPGTIVTALARDAARDCGLRLVEG